MNKLTEMSDNEINVAVATESGLECKQVTVGGYRHTAINGKLVDYCKPSAESMQLMIDNKVDLNTGCELVNDEWEDNNLWDASAAGVIANHVNPCRAIAMCFLMTKGMEL